MKNRKVLSRYLTNYSFRLSLVALCWLSGCSYRPASVQVEVMPRLTPTPTVSANSIAKDESPSGKRTQIESIVREYGRLSLMGKKSELERIIYVIPQKQPVLSEKEKRNGATIPNFDVIAQLERENLLDTTPNWIALGSKSIVSLKVKFDSGNSARVITLFRSRELPEISRYLIFNVSESDSGWRVNLVVWDIENLEDKEVNESYDL